MSELAIDPPAGYTEPGEGIEAALPQITRIAGQMAASCRYLMITAEDLRQEGCMALVLAAERYNPRAGAFDAYAGTVARNAMLNMIRREKLRSGYRTDEQTLPSAPENAGVMADTMGFVPDVYRMTPEQIVIRRETFEEVHRALNTVPARDRVYLWYRFGFDGEEERSAARTAEHFHLRGSNGKKTERNALQKVGAILRGSDGQNGRF